MEEINVGRIIEWNGPPMQPKSAFQQRPIEGLAVEGNQDRKPREEAAKRFEKHTLITWSVKKELFDDEAVPLHIARSDEKDVGPGSHSEPGCLRIEKDSTLQVGVRELRVPTYDRERVAGDGREVRKSLLPVSVARLVRRGDRE